MTALPLKMGQIGYPETPETINLLYATPQKSEYYNTYLALDIRRELKDQKYIRTYMCCKN
jgi:hypothetical protein